MASDLDIRLIEDHGLAGTVGSLIEPTLGDLGFRLVQVRITGDRGQTVQIFAERPDGTLSVDDCADISRAISPVLDASDPISGTYHLEVSSPGIARPLVRGCDFENWAGYEAKIELSQPIDGRKRFRGRLEGFVDGEVRLIIPLKEGASGKNGEMVTIGLAPEMIDRARLVMTDELLDLAKKASEGQADKA